MKKHALILEGGGMRGLYTAGVLDFLLEKEVVFHYCIGVSAGACQGASFVSKQYKRNYRINTEYVTDKRYMSLRNLMREGSLFGMKMLFDTIPNELDPFDYETFRESSTEFKLVTTDCQTGEAVYYTITDLKEGYETMQASVSLPLVAQVVSYDGRALLDGGIVDPIPIAQSVADQNDKHVIVLTQHTGYQKKKTSSLPIVKKKYKQYPKLVEAIAKRHDKYNETLAYIAQLEAEGKCFVIRPLTPLKVGRFEHDPVKLKALYTQGYEECAKQYEALQRYLQA